MSEADEKPLPELDLRLTEENPDDLYEHAPCGYCSCLPDGTLVKLNQTLLDLLGYTRQELVARLCLQELFTIGGRLHYEMHCAPLLILQGQVRELSYSLRRKDGTTLPVLMNAVLRRDTDGNPLLIRVTLFDITDRRKYEDELLRAKEEAEKQQELLQRQNEQLTRINADLDGFVYTASHDLKQPIHNMAGLLAEFKSIATFHDPEADKMIGMFDQALQQILKTIEGLTEVVQRPRELEQAATEAVDLLPFSEEIVRSLQPREVKDVFTLDFTALPTLRIARTALQSILYNLLSNALKYAEPGRPPRIRVSTRLENGVAVLSVQDNGRGINIERHRSHLFQLFRRFHPEVEGVGIGLYLVNRLVAQAGGQIEVESAEGQGTTFHLYLPQ
ncbi:PAS domain-containing sensor histidine kinase [Hymenobacter radiodurans]|uniref:PAS domain-containing sensor histidine kinase n=1 Tax=Hymenobacter radiodurans TaxID=2496028 RepID=UPI001058C898|nr:PAS domain-containing sensor histidine kinase [Hymenobacter radiodurans]